MTTGQYKGHSQVVPYFLAFSSPGFEPSHSGKPHREASFVKVLVELEKLKDFSIGVDRRWPQNEHMHKRRLVPANCPRCVVSLAIHDDILEKNRSALERLAVGDDHVV